VLDVTVLLPVVYISIFTKFVAKNDELINFENRDDNIAINKQVFQLFKLNFQVASQLSK